MQMKNDAPGAHIKMISRSGPDESFFSYTGRVRKFKDFTALSYTETDDAGQKSDVLLRVFDDRLTMIKKGQNSGSMEFAAGEKRQVRYDTSCGRVDFTLFTEGLEIEKDCGEGLHIAVRYILDYGNGYSQEHSLDISVAF